MRSLLTTLVLMGLFISNYADKRIDCFPDRKFGMVGYSKEACLARNCLFDDQALPTEIQCYKIEKLRRSPMKQDQSIVSVNLPQFVKNDPKYRVDCVPDFDEHKLFCNPSPSKTFSKSTTNTTCTARGCTWDAAAVKPILSCHIPLNKGGYNLTSGPQQISSAVTEYRLTRLSSRPPSGNGFSLFNQDVTNLNVQVSVSGVDKLRLTIRNADASRYEVPVPMQWQPSAPTSIPAKINFQLTRNEYGQIGFRVIRAKTQSILFDTSFFSNGFVYEDRFLQFVTTIPSRNIYGFGENVHKRFRHILKDSERFGVFARDQWPTGDNENLYSTHPFYMVIEPDGQAFGVFILNSNAQDYKLDEYDSDKAMLTYRTTGGIFDIMFFVGPTPENVIRQYHSVIGNPYMPPYWGLGFQLSRYGFNTLENMKNATFRTLNANIPLDVMYGDIDYFYNRLDFTYDPVNFKELPQFIDELHRRGMKFITILDPAIDSQEENYTVYTEGQKDNIWIKWPASQNLQFNETGNQNMLGFVWPFGKTVFPDFFNPLAVKWWHTQILEYYKKVKFDGLWIDMNEPANFDTNEISPWNWNDTGTRNDTWNLHCPYQGDNLDNPPYKTAICGNYLSSKTLCMVGEQSNGAGKVYKHYDVHNLYGWSETLPTLNAARATNNKRSIVISRSTFPSVGAIAGHWLGDNNSTWSHLQYNIIGMLEFNLFGIPYIGADTCGFVDDATEELCQRWMQLGAFNPFFRNHNGINYIDQDPGNSNLFNQSAIESNRRVVELRYTLIPYLYTLFHNAHVSGGTVVRSMAHAFPNDSNCWGLDQQFLWDSYLLIAPVIRQGEVNKSLYLPTTERWYDYYTGQEETTRGNITVPAPRDFVPIYVRGGVIIPHQKSAMNTVLSRKNPLYLIVALDAKQTAFGDLFWDDGDSIDTYQNNNFNNLGFSYQTKRLTIEPWTFNYPEMSTDIQLDEITIYGVDPAPTRVVWNGQDLIQNTQWQFNTTFKVLKMNTLRLNLSKIHRINLI